MVGDKDHREASLEQSGDINMLQRYRLHQYWNQVRRDNTGPPFDSHKLFFVEEDLREVVQEEISIKEEHNVLNKDAEERLYALNVKYWLLVQTWVDYRSCLQDGYLQRAFELWWSHPKWYMHPPVPLRSRTEDSVTVALIHLAAEKGPVIALAIAGVVLLALLFREGMMLFFWWTRLKIKRQFESGGAPLTPVEALVETLIAIEPGVLSWVVWEEKGAGPPV
ncbi:hypothetical protein N7501_001041 [Penicillium viridicatum]|nr:hypothetical protein N7501_001041 [Penicillium viridicatum]